MEQNPQSEGGKARARKLSPSRRKEIAAAAAEARWARVAAAEAGDSISRAICGGPEQPLKIDDLEIPCYVLENGQRVIHQRGMVSALGMSRGGSSRGGGDRLAHFVAQKSLKDFVSNDLIAVTTRPLLFRTQRGALAYGYEATVLAEICEAIVDAGRAGSLSKQQEHIALKAEILIRAFARVGVIALVDEATGYQEIRARDELQTILAAYISPELVPWTQTFPDEFYKEMFRVWNWNWPPGDGKASGPRGPRYAGKLTKQLIYQNLPPGVLEDLEEKNPANKKWQRKSRHFQYLSEEVGNPHVEKLVAQITMLFRLARDKNDFWHLYKRAFPKSTPQLELDVDVRQLNDQNS